MVTDATRKFRDVFAFGLLTVAGLYFISGLSLLFKSSDDLAGASFSDRSAMVGYVFAHPVLVFALVVAVALAIGFGEPSTNARVVVLAALALGGASLVFALISWFASFGADTGPDAPVGPSGFFDAVVGFGGVSGAGKVVGIFLGLAQLILLALVLWYAVAGLQSLPKRAPATQQWGTPGYGEGYQGYPGYQGYQAPDQGYGQGQAGWGQQQPWTEQQSWEQQGWGQPPEQQGWGQPPEQQGWGQPPEQPGQQSWGQPGSETQQPSSSEEGAREGGPDEPQPPR